MTTTEKLNQPAEPQHADDLINHDETIAKEVRDRFGQFLEERINPGALERDRTMSTFPPEMMREAAEIGLVGFTAPKEVGGGGNSWFKRGHVLEQIGYLCNDSGLPMLLSYRESATNLVYRSGRKNLIERYVRPAVSGESFIGWVYSEGADPFSFKTTVHRADGGYVVNGEKLAVTGAHDLTGQGDAAARGNNVIQYDLSLGRIEKSIDGDSIAIAKRNARQWIASVVMKIGEEIGPDKIGSDSHLDLLDATLD